MRMGDGSRLLAIDLVEFEAGNYGLAESAGRAAIEIDPALERMRPVIGECSNASPGAVPCRRRAGAATP